MIGSPDDKVLEDWYYILSNGDGRYREFMGDKDGQPGHNRKMLTYLAGFKDPRERDLIIQAWQLHDHMCNTGRAESANKAWRIGLAIAFVLPAAYYFGLFLDTGKVIHLAGSAVYAIASVVIVFGIRFYYRHLEKKREGI